MDWLNEKQEDIEKSLWNSRYGNNPPKLFLYDVTSSYLEGENNELAEHGYNRDGKKHKKQIVIGLLTDHEGMPIAIRVFKGNTQDPKTVEKQINTLVQSFGTKNFTLVGDRGMIKSDQKILIESKESYWITATTKPQIEKLIKDNIIQLSLFTDNLAEITAGNVRYILRKNIVRAQEIDKNRIDKLNRLQKEIDKKNIYLQGHKRAKVQTAINALTKWVDKRKISKWVELKIEGRNISLKKEEDVIKEESKLDGCYVIQSNLPENEADASVIHDRYKDLSNIENHFKHMKTESLEIRPIYHRKAERTKALVFIAMLARMILKVFEEKTKILPYSLDYKVKTLDRIQYEYKKIGELRFKVIPKILDEAKNSILDILKIDLSKAL